MSATREPRPPIADVQPPLTIRANALRLLGCLAISTLAAAPFLSSDWHDRRWYFWVSVGLGLVSYVLVWWRRRFPIVVSTTLALVSGVTGIAAGPATLAAVSLATKRLVTPILFVGLVNVFAGTIYSFYVTDEGDQAPLIASTANVVVTAAVMVWGMYIGSRRELVWTLRERAQRAEREQGMRVDQARQAERARIAREMHDVLAHRITQISMSAGALAFRDDLDADALRQGLSQLHDRSTAALRDLRGVLGVLRDPDTGKVVDHPQPTYADLSRLIAEARQSGLTIDVEERVSDPTLLPEGVIRTLYRIVQEGLTNAAKHAPGSHVRLLVESSTSSADTAELHIELRNPIGFQRSVSPGSGLGLVGLSERALLHQGRMTYRVDAGHFVLEAWIPWQT